MALWQLIRAGVEATVRGITSYLGRGVTDVTTADMTQRVIDHLGGHMQITDPVDRALIPGIVREQQAVVDTARRMNRGEIVGTPSEVPVVSTFQGPAGKDYRYLVVVRTRDPITGATIDYPVEIYSEQWIDAKTVRDIAEGDVMNSKVKPSPEPEQTGTSVGAIVSSSIVSATRRG